ncbi:MAG: hypothetical protein SPH68_08120 [Candidatus Borkfalkiaceae bacterium]|nr:hypothetical protein [Clostridia bacterium]MDY6224104.1 hypothetical protein [Christensenellaceae bacterium]
MRKNKKILTIGFATLSCFFLSLAYACGKTTETEAGKGNVQESPREYADGTYLLCDFENAADLYTVKPCFTNKLNAYGKAGVVFGEQYKGDSPDKTGSLKYAYEKANDSVKSVSSLAFYIEKSACPDINRAKILSFGISVYNASDTVKTVKLGLVSSSKTVCDVSAALNAGWNDISFSVDPVFAMYRIDEVKAFNVEFPTGEACDYYFDDWTVTIGESRLNDMQKSAVNFAETVSSLDGNVTLDSAQTLLSANALYAGLDENCRSAVTAYYNVYQSAVGYFFDLLAKQSGDTVFYFGEEYGVLQVSATDGMNCAYDGEIQLLGEKGALGFGFNDKGDYKTNVHIPTLMISAFDYVAVNAKNESDADVSVVLNASEAETLEAGGERTLYFPAAQLSESGNSITFKTAGATNGNVYLGNLVGAALQTDGIYSLALGAEGYASEDAAVTEEDGRYTITAATEGTYRITPVKTGDPLNVAESVTFGVRFGESGSVEAYDENGNLLRRDVLGAGLQTVYYGSKIYNALSYLTINVGADGVTFTPMLRSRTTDTDYVDIVLKNDSVVKGENVTIDTFREAMYYLSAYESMTLYKQLYLKNNEKEVYGDITARAAKVSGLMAGVIERYKNGEASDTDGKLLLDFAASYRKMKCVDKLTAEQLKIVSEASAALLKYEYTVYDFVNPLTAKMFIPLYNDTLPNGKAYYQWSGSAYLGNKDGNAVMTFKVSVPSKELYMYARYDYSSVQSALSDYDYVTFRIYNGCSAARDIVFIPYAWSSTVKVLTLKANSWNDICLSASEFTRAGYFVIRSVNAGDTFCFGNVTACSYQHVQSCIDALPEPSAVTEEDRAAINLAREKYEKLSDKGKAKINAERLTKCEEALSKP